MKYNTDDPYDQKKMDAHYEKLRNSGGWVELKGLKGKRSLSQNAYLHVCIGIWAVYYGDTIERCKTDLKRECEFMVYEHRGKKYLKETKLMKSDELTIFIDWIRNYAAKNGCYIPTPEEYLKNQFAIDKEIEKHKEYL